MKNKLIMMIMAAVLTTSLMMPMLSVPAFVVNAAAADNTKANESGATVAAATYPGDDYVKFWDENKKLGYKDATGKVVIAPQFAGGNDFSEGLAVVKVATAGKDQPSCGYIDHTGKMVIAPQFVEAKDFSQGFARATKLPHINNSNSGSLYLPTWGYIDRTGKPITAFKYEFVGGTTGEFKDGFAVVCGSNRKYGYIDKTGKEIVKPQYDDANRFSEGLAAVYKEVGKNKEGIPLYQVGYVDTTGKLVIPFKFNRGTFDKGIHDFKNGMVTIGIEDDFGNKWPKVGMMDKTGKVIIAPANRSGLGCLPQFKDGLITFTYFDLNDPYYSFRPGVYDATGKLITDLSKSRYAELWHAGGGYIMARHPADASPDGVYKGYSDLIDSKGNVLLSELFPGTSQVIATYRDGKVYIGNDANNPSDIYDTKTGKLVVPQNVDEVTEGIYRIHPAINTKYELAVQNRSMNDGAAVVLWSSGGTENHMFQVSKSEDGTSYIITAMHSGKKLFVGRTKGQSMTQGSLGTKFRFVKEKDGNFRIQAVSTGYYVGFRGAKLEKNNDLVAYIKSDDGSQTFVFEKVDTPPKQ